VEKDAEGGGGEQQLNKKTATTKKKKTMMKMMKNRQLRMELTQRHWRQWMPSNAGVPGTAVTPSLKKFWWI
jgi:hypothetical protein